jgi:hypothetical protein
MQDRVTIFHWIVEIFLKKINERKYAYGKGNYGNRGQQF